MSEWVRRERVGDGSAGSERVGDGAVDLRGLWVPIITPFTGVGAVDLDALGRLADRLLADGATGLVALGTTGEPATLTAAERRGVVEACDRACRAAGRALIVGAGTNGTSTTIDEIRRLTEGTEAVAALTVVPYYTRPSIPAVVEHFLAVADAVPVPIVAYNIPYRTGRGLDSSALIEIGRHRRVAGLKQSVGALDADTLALLARSGGSLDVLTGDDAFIVPTMLLGGRGAIAAAGHLCTPRFVEMVTAALDGEWSRAAELAAALLPVVEAGFAEPSPAVWKGALARRGEIASDRTRRPMTEASAGAVARLIAAADRASMEPRVAQVAASPNR